MSRGDHFELEGIVTEVLPNTMFRVDIGQNKTVLCTISGKLRTNYIRVLQGDKVSVAISPSDVTRGIIKWRHK